MSNQQEQLVLVRKGIKKKVNKIDNKQLNYSKMFRVGLALLFVLTIFSGIITVFSLQRSSTITIAGSTTLLPLLNSLADKYRKANPSKYISVQGGGSSLGLSYLNRNLVNASSESRYPTQLEYQQNWAGKKITTYLIGGDLIVFIANLHGLISSNKMFFPLNIKSLNQIYSGKTTNWNQISGIKRSTKIIPVNRELGSGTRNVVYGGFDNYKAYLDKNHFDLKSLIKTEAKANNFPHRGIVATSNGEALSWLSSTPGSIGYVSFPYLKSIMPESKKTKTAQSFIDSGFRIINPIAEKNSIVRNFFSEGIRKSKSFSNFSSEVSNADNFKNAWLDKNKINNNTNPPYFFIHPLCISGKETDLNLTKFMNWYLPPIDKFKDNTTAWKWFGNNCPALRIENYIPIISQKSSKYYFHNYKSKGKDVKLAFWSSDDKDSEAKIGSFVSTWRQPILSSEVKPWWYNYFVSWTT